MRISYQYAKEQGARYLLVSAKGDIKGYGRTEAVLLFSRQRRATDNIMPVEEYPRLYPCNH